MAITTLDGVIAGFQVPKFLYKAATGTLVTGRPFTPFYTAGIPGAAVDNTSGLSGAALTSYLGQIPFTNPVSGNSYLARFSAYSTANTGNITLADRLWHNSGLVVTTTTAQTVNSVAWPARDNNGTTNGQGVLIGLEISGATGAGTATPSISYTNSDGVAGRTASLAFAYAASSPVGTFYPFSLRAGDKGVRSIQTCTLNVSMTSGKIHLVAYRPIANLPLSNSSAGSAVDVLTGGMPRLFDNTVPFVIFTPSNTTTSLLGASMVVTQG